MSGFVQGTLFMTSSSRGLQDVQIYRGFRGRQRLSGNVQLNESICVGACDTLLRGLAALSKCSSAVIAQAALAREQGGMNRRALSVDVMRR